ncbi:ATP-binding cassette domain-containing protein [Paenibacillus sp. CC-CFT747]|nr:ATP-binding cassette domain-containing protein [Paenibacillus sp. CC-CFT747]
MIVRNLSKRFGSETEVLSGISFQVDQGEFVAIIGSSGSGKSTLLRCLSLQETWTEGEYIYEGRDITKLNPLEKFKVRKNWAFLEEKPNVNLRTTAQKNVWTGRWKQTPLWRLVTRRAAMDEHVMAADYLEKVGLLDKGDEKVEKLSGGEQQRVALAKALVQEAQVIFADEPVRGLDPASSERVMEDLRKTAKRDNVTIICCLHKLELAERYATRIMGLSGGKIVLDIPARRLTLREKDMIL